MRLGIVGHEAAKFTLLGEVNARRHIWQLIVEHKPSHVVSGRSPLGGVDIWAEEEAAFLEVPTLIFPPKTNNWHDGYKPRNLAIAGNSDKVAVILADKYPPDYRGMRFNFCYHCNTAEHIKSGGCWTAKQCKGGGLWIIVDNCC